MDAEQVRVIARSLPETTEAPHGGRQAFRTRNRVYVVIENDEDGLVLYVSADERQALTAQDPATFREITDRRGAIVEEWVVVSLATADADQLRELLEDAWRRLATRRAIKALEAV